MPSMRSSSRDTSGTFETSRSEIARPQCPSGPAPRRIRSTLYWSSVMP